MYLLNYLYFVPKLHHNSYMRLVSAPTLPATCRNQLSHQVRLTFCHHRTHIVRNRLFNGSQPMAPTLSSLVYDPKTQDTPLQFVQIAFKSEQI